METVDPVKVGEFISKVRKNNKLTQKYVAKQLNVTNKAISKWECGNGLPDVSLLVPLSKVLGVSVTEILSGEYIESETFNKSTADEMTLRAVDYSRNQFKSRLKRILFGGALLIILITLLWYFISSFNSIRFYRLQLNSKNFIVDNGMYMKSKMKNVFQLGDLRYTGESEIIEDKVYALVYVENGEDDIIIYDGIYSPIYIYEKYGNEEYFSDKTMELMKDNLFIKLRALTTEGEEINETHKITVDLEFANNKIVNFKESSKERLLVSDNVAKAKSGQSLKQKLINAGFDNKGIVTVDGSVDFETYTKEQDEYVISVNINVTTQIFITSSSNDSLILQYNEKDKKVKIFMNNKMVLNSFYDNVDVEKNEDELVKQITLLLKQTVDLLNNK